MKKIFLLVICCCSLISCKTYNPQGLYNVYETNEKKLPTLEAVYIDATSSTPQYWTPGQRVVQQGGTRATIFYEEVEKNITNPRGKLQGYIELREETFLSPNYLWAIASGLTLCTINLFGFPIGSYTATSIVQLRILDKNGGLIKRYESASISDTEYIALWWGYAETIDNGERFKLKTFRRALDLALQQIKDDYDYLNNQLKK